MSWFVALIDAGIHGLATVLPISGSGHDVALRIWFGLDPRLDVASAGAELGCAIALGLALWWRLAASAREVLHGLRAPAMFMASNPGRDAVAILLGSALGLASELWLRRLVTPLETVPLAVGLGLGLTAATLGITALAPTPRRTGPSLGVCLTAGLAYGLAVAPGLSQLAASFAVLCWLGIEGRRAAELSLLITVPVLILRSARSLVESAVEPAATLALVALSIAVGAAGAIAGLFCWRWLCVRGRSAWLALWIVPLAVATVAYGSTLR